MALAPWWNAIIGAPYIPSKLPLKAVSAIEAASYLEKLDVSLKPIFLESWQVSKMIPVAVTPVGSLCLHITLVQSNKFSRGWSFDADVLYSQAASTTMHRELSQDPTESPTSLVLKIFPETLNRSSKDVTAKVAEWIYAGRGARVCWLASNQPVDHIAFRVAAAQKKKESWPLLTVPTFMPPTPSRAKSTFKLPLIVCH